jgi:hypothetical protein
MAGLLDTPPAASHLVPLAWFADPEVAAVQRPMFGTLTRSRALSRDIQSIKER